MKIHYVKAYVGIIYGMYRAFLSVNQYTVLFGSMPHTERETMKSLEVNPYATYV